MDLIAELIGKLPGIQLLNRLRTHAWARSHTSCQTRIGRMAPSAQHKHQHQHRAPGT